MHGRAPDALERAEQEALHLAIVGRGDRDERELLDVPVELLVLQRQADAGDQLTELIELGRLERDGITRLDVHRVHHFARWNAARDQSEPTIGTESARLLDDQALEAGLRVRDLRDRAVSSTSTSSVATATSRTHLWSAGTTYHGAHSVDVAVIASS